MNSSLRVRIPGRLFLACAFAAPLITQHLRAQVAPDALVLDEVVVTATRTPTDVRQIGSSVEKISGDEVSRQQLTTLASALNGAAGAPVTTGATGGITSVFLRGSNSNQTLFLVDGVRLGDSNTAYRGYVGGAMPSRYDNIEVVRGPQSTLYGADAVGGAVSISAQRGKGAPTASVSASGGSFGTAGGSLEAQGERGKWAYSAFVGGYHTDNERGNNAFDTTTLVLRVDHTLTETVSLGATVRGFYGEFQSPDDITVNDPNNFDREQNWLATVFAEFNPTEDLSAKLTVGGQLRRVVSETPAPNPGFAFPGILDNERALVDGQATYSGIDYNRITAGFSAEASVGQNSGGPDRTQSQWGVFIQDEINPLENVFVTGGLRYDSFNRFDDKVTGRGTIAWLVVPEKVKLRASYGTAYRTPAFTDLYGFFGNPNIRPENARGGDAGVDFYLPEKRGVLSATYFQNRYTDLIDYPAPAFTPQNVGKARTEGVELSAKVALTDTLTTKAAYTYLEAKNLSAGTRLARRPRHAIDLDVWNDFGGGVSAGAGLHAVADSRDIDAVTFAAIDGEDYTTVRVYAAWEVNDRLTLRARVENLFDEDYAAVNGFPSLGIGAFAGAEWKF
jgi:vitamin B12 transporter